MISDMANLLASAVLVAGVACFLEFVFRFCCVVCVVVGGGGSDDGGGDGDDNDDGLQAHAPVFSEQQFVVTTPMIH